MKKTILFFALIVLGTMPVIGAAGPVIDITPWLLKFLQSNTNVFSNSGTKLNGVGMTNGTATATTFAGGGSGLTWTDTDGVTWTQRVTTAGEVTAVAHDWYVNSITGSDSNDGKTPITPFKTLGKLQAQTLSAGTKVALARGSIWREGLTTPGTGISVSAYGRGAPPLLDGSDVLTNSTFALTSGRTSVWERAVTLLGFIDPNKTTVNCYENGTNLIRTTSIANCEATNGSYFLTEGASTNIYINPYGGTSPTNDGKLYEFTRYITNRLTVAANDSARGIWVRRSAHNDGSLLVTGGTVIDCITSDGGVHNALVNEGSILNGVVATNAYWGSGTPVIFVWNQNSPTGQPILFTNCVAANAYTNSGMGNCTAWYGHRNVSGTFGTITVANCIASNVNGVVSSDHTTNCVVRDCFFTNGITGGISMSTAGATLLITNTTITTLTRALNIDVAGTTEVRNSRLGVSASWSMTCIYAPSSATRTLILGGNTFTGSFGLSPNTSSGLTLVSTNNNFTALGGYAYYLANATGVTSDRNSFKASGAVVNVAGEKTLAQWRTYSGQDMNSTP